MSKIIRWLLVTYIKKHPEIYVWSISADPHTDIDIVVRKSY